MNYFNNYLNILREHTDIKIKFKNESFLMIMLSKILFFNDFNMYVTTIGNTIYYPSIDFITKNELDSIVLLAHEYIHIEEQNDYKIKFTLSYIFPQVLFLLVFLSFFSKLWLLSLLFLLPLPAYWRKGIELRGYKGSIIGYNTIFNLQKLSKEEKTKAFEKIVDNINKQFTSSSYYFMWPLGVKKELSEIVTNVLNKPDNEYPYNIMKLGMTEALIDYPFESKK